MDNSNVNISESGVYCMLRNFEQLIVLCIFLLVESLNLQKRINKKVLKHMVQERLPGK